MDKLSLWVAVAVFVAGNAWCPGAETNVVIAPHARDLVVLRGERLEPFESRAFLSAPVTIVYFGAGWCPDCRRFSPKLVSAYNAQEGAHKFEVLFISRDKTEAGMLKFMRDEQMPWPALAFGKIAGAEDLSRLYSGKGIPCLTVINREGKVLKQSESDQDAAGILASLASGSGH